MENEMRKFKEVSNEEFARRIIVKSTKPNASSVMRTPYGIPQFHVINPNEGKMFKLKKTYKQKEDSAGLYTGYNAAIKSQAQLLEQARQKLGQNNIQAQHHINPDASLKLHVSLNNIQDLDENIVFGLIDHLIKLSEDPSSNLQFKFKATYPSLTFDNRFDNNDQLTLYFDKYSSTAEMLRLAEEIERYLKAQGLPENKKPLGAKDTFGFNSFVSARFDHSKIDDKYGIYNFFDEELKKFFETHKNLATLEKIPVCAFEVAFNNIITSVDIQNLRAGSNQKQGLSDTDSNKVQAQFEQMLKDPKAFMNQPQIAAQNPRKHKQDLQGLVEVKSSAVREQEEMHRNPAQEQRRGKGFAPLKLLERLKKQKQSKDEKHTHLVGEAAVIAKIDNALKDIEHLEKDIVEAAKKSPPSGKPKKGN